MPSYARTIFIHRVAARRSLLNHLVFQSPENLGYLTSTQALADYADLIVYLKKTMRGAKHSPVVTVGGSYGGLLAAWFRMKYPFLCTA